MIKFVLAAVWIVAAAVGAVVYSFQSAQSHGSEGPPAPYFGGLDYIKTDVLSIPLLTNNRVYGYFLARLVYTVEPDVMQKLSLPAEALLIDQVYTYLYGNPEIDFSAQGEARPRQVPDEPARFDQCQGRQGIRSRCAHRAGRLPVQGGDTR